MLRNIVVVAVAAASLALVAASPALAEDGGVPTPLTISRGDVHRLVVALAHQRAGSHGARAAELGRAIGRIAQDCGGDPITPTCIRTVSGTCLRLFPRAKRMVPNTRAGRVIKANLGRGFKWGKEAIGAGVAAAIAAFFRLAATTQGCIAESFKAIVRNGFNPKAIIVGCVTGILKGRAGNPVDPNYRPVAAVSAG